MEQPMQELASRVSRLAAVIVDAIIMMVINLPVMAVAGVFGQIARGEQMSFAQSLLWGLFGIVVFLIVNGYFLARDGQTVGKKVLGVRIVRNEDGQLQSAGKVIGLRYVLLQVIYSVPCVGSLFALVDVLFIFREDKRCIHDMIAGTKVVKV